ncbi:MAG: class I SAM-dependent methyltransferase [Xanthobacteraceae bacterium]|nr:class I SAM-dependent methyltransferase [Xanthobacteraceae bacterium]
MTALGTKAWDDLYASGRHNSVWPWSDVVSLVMRFARPQPGRTGFRVMELGCGAGANIPFFEALGVDYHGIDASSTVIAQLRDTFPALASNLAVADFTRSWPFEGSFDLVLDRAAITHNDIKGVMSALTGAHCRLKPGGMLICIDLFSTASGAARAGKPGPEAGTQVNFVDGPLAGTGIAHFFDEAELRLLFAAFEVVHLQHKVVTTIVPESSRDLSSWNLVARRL